MKNIEKTCRAVASYLLFVPDDETMKENKDFYLTLDGVTLDMFQPRPEALQYFERDRGEKALLHYIEQNFQFDEGDIHEAINVDGVNSAAESPLPADESNGNNEIVGP